MPTDMISDYINTIHPTMNMQDTALVHYLQYQTRLSDH